MDKVFETWLERQHDDGRSLSALSDLVSVVSESSRSPGVRFIASFNCPTMVRRGGAVLRVDGFSALVQFPPDYLRVVQEAPRIVALLAPRDVFHPNVAYPFVCTGRITPGTGLIEIVLRLYEILVWQRFTPREGDALNRDACAWARRHMPMFPLTSAPLGRLTPAFKVDEIEPNPNGAGHASV